VWTFNVALDFIVFKSGKGEEMLLEGIDPMAMPDTQEEAKVLLWCLSQDMYPTAECEAGVGQCPRKYSFVPAGNGAYTTGTSENA
jgi:hypothetical protein